MAITTHGSSFNAPATKILVFPDHYVAVAQTFPVNDPRAVTQPNGRKIIPQGTVYPANDDTAIGVVFHDMDVTEDDTTGAVILHGFLRGENLPAALSAAAQEKLPMICVLPNAANPNP